MGKGQARVRLREEDDSVLTNSNSTHSTAEL